jgi:hypothetical protein
MVEQGMPLAIRPRDRWDGADQALGSDVDWTATAAQVPGMPWWALREGRPPVHVRFHRGLWLEEETGKPTRVHPGRPVTVTVVDIHG